MTKRVDYGDLTDEARILVLSHIFCIDMRPAFQEAVSAIERDDAASLAALIRAGLDVNTTHSELEGFDYSPEEIPSLLH